MSHQTHPRHDSTGPGDRAGLVTLGGGALLIAAFLVDGLTGVFGLTGAHGRSAYPAAYVMLSLGTLLLAPGLVATALTFRRRFGTLTFVGLASAGLGFLLMSLGAALNFTGSSSAVDPTTGGAVVFGGIALSAFAAAITGYSLWQIDVMRPAAAVLVTAFLGFLLALLVGESVAAVAGFGLAWSVYGLLLATGWALVGNYVRTQIDNGRPEPVQPPAPTR